MRSIQDLALHRFDTNRWVVTTPDGNHMLLNENSKKLLDILQNTNQNSALAEFNRAFNQSLTQQDFEKLIEEKFIVLLPDQKNKNNKKQDYLSMRLIVFNKRVAGFLAQPFTFLFSPLYFWFLFLFSVILNVVIGFSYFSFDASYINTESTIMYFSIVYATMLIHELGHIAACRKFKVKHGEIGFGFYLIFPVLYANVTNVWTLEKNKRIIANLGGIYLEILYSTLLVSIFLISGYQIFLYCSLTIFIKALTELNPFIRYDGYWVLSDVTNTPNLLPKSNAVIKSLFRKRLPQDKYHSLSKLKYYALLFYGLSNFAIIITYMGLILIKYNGQILKFPLTLFSLFKKLTHGNFTETYSLLTVDNLLIFGFY